MKRMNCLLVALSLFAIPFQITNVEASSIEDCAAKYKKRGKFLGKLGFGQVGGSLLLDAALGAASGGIVFAAGVASSPAFSEKGDNFLNLGKALFAVAQGSRATEEEIDWLEGFRFAVNGELEREDQVDRNGLAAILKNLVAQEKICQVRRIVKRKRNGEIKRKRNGDEKVRFEGWVMKPKNVEAIVRQEARLLAANQ